MRVSECVRISLNVYTHLSFCTAISFLSSRRNR